jgi:hypothetical protein
MMTRVLCANGNSSKDHVLILDNVYTAETYMGQRMLLNKSKCHAQIPTSYIDIITTLLALCIFETRGCVT